MDKIYLIVCGEYSDWRVLGFFEKCEDAERYCALKNRTGGDLGDELSVMECEKPKADGLKNIKAGYVWNAVFNYETNELDRVYEKDIPTEEKEIEEFRIIEHWFQSEIVYSKWLAIDDPRANEEAFRKIACDRFAKWLYEHEAEGGGRK